MDRGDDEERLKHHTEYVDKYLSTPPDATEQELFEYAGYRGVINWNGCNVNWPMYAEKQQIEHMRMFDDDVIVASLPRSGTTWTQELVWLLLHDGNFEAAQAENLETRFPFLEAPYCRASTVATLDRMHRPRTIKTHLLYEALPAQVQTVKPKIVHVVRNPKDYALSHYYFSKEMTEVSQPEGYMLDDFVRCIMKDKGPYGPVFDHIFSYYNRLATHDNICFITYEQLHTEYMGTIRQLAKFLGKTNLSDAMLEAIGKYCLFDNFKNNPSVNFAIKYNGERETSWFRDGGQTFIRNGQIGNWKKHFSPQLDSEFQAWIDLHLKGTDLHFKYE